ncbi:uncharacterized protein LOC130807557 [Amaranthus tricolor]|uniref:uncharacterized protein LOC130807557 n=1 Tax=Amaranthus tricolor TaxID=29722 RepID=UPI002590E58A|nr:uncharacterized protein LOC130807557 [Amaranthus tricolor]
MWLSAASNAPTELGPARVILSACPRTIVQSTRRPIEPWIEDTFRGRYDQNQWRFDKKVYNAASGYEWIRGHQPTVDWCSWVWNRLNIPKTSFITWVAMWKRLSTKDRLKRFGVSSEDCCPLCEKEPETIAHLFFSCDYADACSRLLRKELDLQNHFVSLDQLAEWMKKPVSQRNDVIWNAKLCHPRTVVKRIKNRIHRIMGVMPRKVSDSNRTWMIRLLS